MFPACINTNISAKGKIKKKNKKKKTNKIPNVFFTPISRDIRSQKEKQRKVKAAHHYYGRFNNVHADGPGIVENGMIKPLPCKTPIEELGASLLIGTSQEMIDRLVPYAELGIDATWYRNGESPYMHLTGSADVPKGSLAESIPSTARWADRGFRRPGFKVGVCIFSGIVSVPLPL